jgi:hypothetical protein
VLGLRPKRSIPAAEEFGAAARSNSRCGALSEFENVIWRPFLRSIYEREAGDLKAVPAVHHLYTNLALGMAPLPEGDLIQTQAIFRSAIWTFENPHYLAMRSFLHKGQLNSAQRSWRLVHE